MDPLLGKIQSDINRNGESVLGQHTEHSDLTVVDLAKTSKPLPGYAHRHGSLLGKTAFINQQPGVDGIADKPIGFTGQMINHTARIPLAVRQKLLKVSGFGIRYDLFHPVHIPTGTGLHQPASILTGFLRHIMTVGLKVVAKAFHERHKAPAKTGERRLRGGIRFSPSFMVPSAECVS